MPDQRQVQKNAVSNQSGDNNIEEAIWRLKINDTHDGGSAAQISPYPGRPGEPDCLYYLRTGACGYGSNCRYNHPAYVLPGAQYGGELPERAGQPDCEYFLKTGTCKYGSACKYHHPRDRRGARPILFNVLGLPMRQEEKSCPYYMRTGSCKFGVACKFHHPQPASLGNVFPMAGPPASTYIPSVSLPYASGTSAWVLPKTPYLYGLHSQGHQSYTPLFYSTSQGVVSPLGWNTYVGSMNSASSANTLGSNALYSSMNIGEMGSSEQVNLLLTATSNLPERPDQPECRYYMSTGTCKYGSDCKFHHPKERAVQLALNAFGLPSRPGQPICSYYRVNGLCKYGQTCKFDHPLVAHPYNYGVNLAALSVIDPSLLSYPRGLSNVQPAEISPLKSPKLPDHKPPARDESQKTDSTRTTEDSSERADSPPNCIKTTESLHE